MWFCHRGNVAKSRGDAKVLFAQTGPPSAVLALYFSLNMAASLLSIPKLLQRLESCYGRQEPGWPTDPYLFLVWWHSGYPASDDTCARGWASLNRSIGVASHQILAASQADLATALRAGGMVPDVRAIRLQQIAACVEHEFGGDLRAALIARTMDARKLLKKFPGIAGPGADRILLFGGIVPIAAIPSNCPQVLVRIQRGAEGPNYGATYQEAQTLLDAEVPRDFASRTRAYLLLKRHGQEVCKRSRPKCELCQISANCNWFAGSVPGRDRSFF